MNNRPFRTLIFFVVFIMLMSGCSVIKTISVINSGEPAQLLLTEQEIPFTMKAHAILVKARINDSKKSYTFMVDTGAINGIDKGVAHELMLQNEAEIDLFDSGNNIKKTNLVKFASISIGNVKVKDCGAVLVDDLSSKIGVDGILGSNFIKYFRVTIDYKNHILVFANSRQELPAANRTEEVIPFTLNMKYGFAPKVACLVDGNISVDALVDTGAIGLDLPVKIIKKTEEFSSGRVLASEGALTSGFTGTARNDYLLRLKTFSMGGFKAANIPCGSTQSTVALFGQRALRHFLVTLDYPAGKMILKRHEDMEFDNNVYSLGIGIQKRQRQDDRNRIL